MNVQERILGPLLKPVLTFMSRRRLPQMDGRLRVAGLDGDVTIHRDEWSIPHIYAGSRHDLFFAQGYLHAQDRLWQMELNRRVAQGKLAELFGRRVLDVDRLTRTLGFARLAEHTWSKLSQRRRDDLLSYAAGVNAFLQAEGKLPVEFTLLRTRPQVWEPIDSIALGRLLIYSLSHGWAGELTRARLIERLGPELAAELEPRYPERNPVILPEGIEFNKLSADGMLQATTGPFLGRGRVEGGGRGSNNWVIGPGRSTTGHAILCNDMHLPMTNPSLWYYWHLNGPESHVAGVGQPGLPYVMVGHNENIAWGATLAFTDVEDLFIERLHPSGDGRYEYQGAWLQAEVMEEEIIVRGEQPHIERIVVTHHGPIVSPLFEGAEEVLALSSMALRPDHSFEGFPALSEARDWDNFIDAVRQITSPPLNLVYADSEGNIGYAVSGQVPIRARGQGLIPAPGWTGEDEWIGVVPFEEMPHCLNPQRGLIITANHRIVGDDYPYYLGSIWSSGFRARRLEALMSVERIGPDDCRQIHFDRLCTPALELISRLQGLEPADEDGRLALDLLNQWDGWLSAESLGGTVYHVLLKRLAEVILGGALGDLLPAFLGAGHHPVLSPMTEFYGYWNVALSRMLDDPATTWLADVGGREAVLMRCLSETTARLRSRLGSDPCQWQWGRVHELTFEHVLAEQTPFDLIFNLGPYPIGGDANTVFQAASPPGSDKVAISVSYRQIIDLGDFDNSLAMYAPGQSGNLASPHYRDLVEPWMEGGYFPMRWSRLAVEAAARHTLTLTRREGDAR